MKTDNSRVTVEIINCPFGASAVAKSCPKTAALLKTVWNMITTNGTNYTCITEKMFNSTYLLCI